MSWYLNHYPVIISSMSVLGVQVVHLEVAELACMIFPEVNFMYMCTLAIPSISYNCKS